MRNQKRENVLERKQTLKFFWLLGDELHQPALLEEGCCHISLFSLYLFFLVLGFGYVVEFVLKLDLVVFLQFKHSGIFCRL